MKRIVLALFAVAPLSIACPAHVQLAAPSDDAPFDERAAAYEELRPLHADRVTTVSMIGNSPVVSSGIPYLQLANGARVTWPDDLKPVVDDGSPTAAAIDEWSDARARSDAWSWTALGLLSAGSLVYAGTIPLALVMDDGSGGPNAPILVGGLVGGGAIMLTSAVPFAIGLVESMTAQQARETAFTTYEASLQKKLGVRSATRSPLEDVVRDDEAGPATAQGL